MLKTTYTYDIISGSFRKSKINSQSKEKNALKEKTIEELIAELMKTCGLGNIISPITPVSGGFMHRMYRVTTDCGIYAVKHLNPEIMSRSGV